MKSLSPSFMNLPRICFSWTLRSFKLPISLGKYLFISLSFLHGPNHALSLLERVGQDASDSPSVKFCLGEPAIAAGLFDRNRFGGVAATSVGGLAVWVLETCG